MGGISDVDHIRYCYDELDEDEEDTDDVNGDDAGDYEFRV